ncbi:hypothetical protein SCOR_20220 [Sulfidibacter corallicola]|uniref:Uncharacterized protein n=1 Tax=Sulfidibacter corallicola TaxID=2818388 RepID=A0A8A4TW89_SULCO|nr:hypothetical protein [Sulfidibacter corallicola]QTD53232.1 hypothetical protein J3U87_12315 [Sulfidibacter corallicola]
MVQFLFRLCTRSQARYLLPVIALCFVSCYRETGEETLPVTATQITSDNVDTLPTGKEASSAIGDFLLQNSELQIVVNGAVGSAERDHYFAKSAGAVLDFTSAALGADRTFVTQNNDGLHQLSQTVNLNRHNPVGYSSIRVNREDEATASLVMTGSVYDMDGSLAAAGAPVGANHRVEGLEVITTYRMQNRELDENNAQTGSNIAFMTVTTVLANNSQATMPVFTINDALAYDDEALATFVPFPEWGFAIPTSEERVQSFAYPHYFQLIPRQSNTAHYGIVSRLDGVLMADRELIPEQNLAYAFVGKRALPTQTLAPGGQLTYVREMHADISNSAVSPRIIYNFLQNLLSEETSATSPYSTTRPLIVGGVRTLSAPGGTFQLEYINESVQYFNGAAYVNLEQGRSYPIVGDVSIPPGSFGFDLPLGQLALRTNLDNNEPFYTDVSIVSETDDDGNTTETEIPIILTEEDTDGFGLSAVDPTTTRHQRFDLDLATTEQRELLGRASIYRISDEGPMTLSDTPNLTQGNHLVLRTITEVSTNLPFGTYNVYMSRGPLHNVNVVSDVVSRTVVDDEGNETFEVEPQDVDFEMSPVLSLPNYLSADFDARSAFDAEGLIEITDMVRYGFAEDLDVLFFPDDNRVLDVDIILRAEALQLGSFDKEDDEADVDSLFDEVAVSRTTAILGRDESGPWGRFSIFSLPTREQQSRVTLPSFEADPAGFFSRLHSGIPGSLVQATRPRGPAGPQTGYFTALAERGGIPAGQAIPGDSSVYSQGSPAGGQATRLDFDLLQVLSGNRYDEYLLTRQDWFNLLNAGVFKPATGGSKAGDLQDLPQGSVRTWIQVTETTLRDIDLTEFWTNASQGNSFISNGPLIEASVNGVSYGGETSVSGGSATLNLKISAAPWVQVPEVRIIVDGQVQVIDVPLDPNNLVRFDGAVTIDLPTSGRHWVVVEAGAPLSDLQAGQGASGTGIFGRVLPGHLPLAFTNPIFLDN